MKLPGKGDLISLNASSSVLQALITGLMYFFLYKYLIDTLGKEMLGIWSLVVATTSLGNLANFGLTSSLIKFVAEFRAKNQQDDIASLLVTAGLTIVTFFSVIVVVIYFGAYHFLGLVIDEASIGTAISVLPYSLLSLMINALGGIFTSSIEGFQLNYVKNFIYVISLFLFLTATFLLTKRLGLLGVVSAQIMQALFVLSASYVFVTRKILRGRWLNLRVLRLWNTPLFRMMFSYGYKFQFISLLQIMLEPITKGFVSSYAGLQPVAYYEMANRLVSQFRSLIISGNQIMIPVIATAKLSGVDEIRNIYVKSLKIIFLVEVPLIASLIIFAPLISWLWLGNMEPQFVYFLYILLFGTFISILNGPAYFGVLGEGNLSIMVILYGIILVLTLALSYALSQLSANYGAIVGGTLSIIVGTMTMTYIYQKHIQVKLSEIFAREEARLMAYGMGISLLSILAYPFGFEPAIILGYSVILLIVLWLLILPIVLRNSQVSALVAKYPKIRRFVAHFNPRRL